ncbi:hypothetical protein [Pseudomonas songnenensis]|uniref:Uncharacterized protein n=1 Tax=Pseudomonas songnenensis TaxID=1176259 RepID=A0A482UL93_9PSED|nr:hypothetical protein [Pseudomonas songnenensis]RYJ63238.1 hypothetical protein EJA06_004600 [Pseudomonas songnenensis]
MISVTLKGAKQVADALAKYEKQVPFATALALTRTAQIAKTELEKEMRSVFDRPTRWTLNSLRLFPAKKDKLEARVWMKNEADKSVPATRWLNPEIEGGPRQDKRSESRLRRKGILPAGKYIVPGKGAKLDSYGNMTKGAITKALSGLQAFNDAGYSANATGSKRSRAKGNAKRYFVMKRGSMPIGIAERTSRNRMHILLAFTRKPTYSKRLDFYGIGDKVVKRHLAAEFEKAMTRAMRTAR